MNDENDDDEDNDDDDHVFPTTISRFKMCLLFYLAALALKCGLCTDAPGNPGAAMCNASSIGSWTCPQYWDRCLIMNVTYKNALVNASMSHDFVIKNCTSTMGCNSTNQYYGKRYDANYECDGRV